MKGLSARAAMCGEEKHARRGDAPFLLLRRLESVCSVERIVVVALETVSLRQDREPFDAWN